MVHLNIHINNKHTFTCLDRNDVRTAEGNVHSVIPAPSEVHLATFLSGCVMEKVRPGQHLLSQSGEQFVHIVTDSELHVLRSDEDTPDWCGSLRSLL